MSAIDRHRFDQLLESEGPGPHLSIYLPTHRAGRNVRQDPIRLKNLIREAEADLLKLGLKPEESHAFLAPVRALLDSSGYWEHQLDGLALFLDGDGLRDFQCPRRFDEFRFVGEHFHLKPLLPLLRWETSFHLLALSLNKVALYEVTADALEEIDAGDIPASLADALGHDVEEPSLQHHAGARPGPGRETGIFHGPGAGDDDKTGEIIKFLQLVDDGLRARLKNLQAPVVLAGVDKLIHRFHDLSKHQGLIPGGVAGNPDSLESRRLHEEAWEVARGVLGAPARRAAERFVELRGTDRASAKLQEIGRAAAAGRVESLLIAADRTVWGTLEGDGSVEVHDEFQEGDVDLLDRLAVLGLRNGAEVIARQASRLPDGVAVGAVMRY
ncbi:MAG: hypothetical protein ABIK96_06070 [bacterium]